MRSRAIARAAAAAAAAAADDDDDDMPPFSDRANFARAVTNTRTTPRVAHKLTNLILCETRDVRLMVRDDTRFFQFRGSGVVGGYPWRNNEAMVHCQENIQSLQCTPSHGAVKSASECPPCLCTPVPIPRWNLHGFGYVQVMFDTVTSHDARCSSGTGMSPTQKNPFRMLQIGLGGGTFAMNAMRKCHAVVDVIEGQPDVAAMAQRFLGFSTGGQLIVADGLDGLKTLATAAEAKGGAGSLYDAIAVDCMVQGQTPAGCKADEFIRLLSVLLKKSGAITQWSWPADRVLLRRRYQEHFMNVSDVSYMSGGVFNVRAPMKGKGRPQRLIG